MWPGHSWADALSIHSQDKTDMIVPRGKHRVMLRELLQKTPQSPRVTSLGRAQGGTGD